MDSNFEIPPVAHSRNNHCTVSSSLIDRNPHAWCSVSPKTTAPTVKLIKEKEALKMDNCIDSDGEVSYSDADNVPVSVSEEEEAPGWSILPSTILEMESEEDEEKDSKAAPTHTIKGEVPCVSPPVNEEDNDNKEDNDDNGDNDDNKEDYCDFNLKDIEGMSKYEVLRLQKIHRNNAKLASLSLLGGMKSATSPSINRCKVIL